MRIDAFNFEQSVHVNRRFESRYVKIISTVIYLIQILYWDFSGYLSSFHSYFILCSVFSHIFSYGILFSNSVCMSSFTAFDELHIKFDMIHIQRYRLSNKIDMLCSLCSLFFQFGPSSVLCVHLGTVPIIWSKLPLTTLSHEKKFAARALGLRKKQHLVSTDDNSTVVDWERPSIFAGWDGLHRKGAFAGQNFE